MDLSLATIASGKVSSLSLLDHPFCNQPLNKIFVEVSPGDWPITQLALSTRSANALFRMDIHNLRTLGSLSPNDISDFRNTGLKTTKEILDGYISKLGLEYTHQEPNISSSEGDPNIELTYVSHIWKVLEFLATRLDRREVALISNALSVEKIKISKISDTWGISRQRTYQIVDKLLEKLSESDSLSHISRDLFREKRVLTKSEAFVGSPYLSLGVSSHDTFLTVLDLMIYSKNVVGYRGFILVDPLALNLSSDDLFIQIGRLRQADPTQISPEVTSILHGLINENAEPSSIDPSLNSSLERANAWLDDQSKR